MILKFSSSNTTFQRRLTLNKENPPKHIFRNSMPGSVCSSEHVCKPNTKSPCISICWAWQHPLKVSLFTTNHTDQGDKIRARNRWQTQSLGGREVNKEWGKVVRHQYKQRNTKDLLGQRRLNELLDSTEHILSSCSCFTLGATVPYIYASATL